MNYARGETELALCSVYRKLYYKNFCRM